MIRYVDNLTDKLEDAKDLIFLIQQGKFKYVGLDTETTGLDPFTSDILLVQIKIGDDIFILNRGGLGKEFITNLVSLIEDSGVMCIGHNIKFDAKMLRQDTGVWLTHLYDTMIVEQILTCGLGNKYPSLAELVFKYCGVTLEKESRLDFIELNHNSVFTEQQLTYSATDVLYLEDIMNKQMEIAVESNLTSIVDLEMKLVPVVMGMEREGITLDVEYWKTLTKSAEVKTNELGNKLVDDLFSAIKTSKYKNAFDFATAVAIPVSTKRLTKALTDIVDPSLAMGWIKENFNLGSPKQLLTALQLTGIDTDSTNEKVLNKIEKNPIIDLLLEYRGYQKLVSTYGYNIIESIHPITGRIHTDFNQIGAATGRFSSSGAINMQNIPRDNDYRGGFIAKPGYSFLAVDYSQCEYRLAGALSGEPLIIEAYKKGSDMHIATASLKFGKPFEDITKDERNFGKTMNFAVIYGTTVWGLMRNFSIPESEAQKLLDDYWAGYPRLSTFKTAVEDMIVKFGYSITPMGRKRYFAPLGAFATPREVNNHLGKMKREGFNMVIQGGTADVLKLAMLEIPKKNPFGDRFNLILQIHDELVVEVEDSIIKDATEFMVTEMEKAFQPILGEIPAKADPHVSKRWEKT
jgi:DNA polymerase-1